MPFDRLPGANLQIPEFRPVTVTQLPKQSIWPGIAQGVAGTVGTLAKALDPVEKAQRKLALAQLSFRTKAMEDYQSGKLSADDFDPNTGMPYTTMQKLQIQDAKDRIIKRNKEMQYLDLSRNSTYGDIYRVPQQTQQRNDSLPPGGPVEPDELNQPPSMDRLPSVNWR